MKYAIALTALLASCASAPVEQELSRGGRELEMTSSVVYMPVSRRSSSDQLETKLAQSITRLASTLPYYQDVFLSDEGYVHDIVAGMRDMLHGYDRTQLGRLDLSQQRFALTGLQEMERLLNEYQRLLIGAAPPERLQGCRYAIVRTAEQIIRGLDIKEDADPIEKPCSEQF
ncbi:MAG TPA: hypothetical protein VJH88_05380 [Candidatus Nanoarchaeia archaeon]|nr:hypothetical protein [Candidatus Nanoarchaeia archaeon]